MASTDGSARREPRPDTVGGLRKIGWLVDAKRIVSPNHDSRPDGTAIDLVVIHNISLPPGIYGGNAVVELFTNKLDPGAHPYFATIADLRVSSHVLIRRDGEVIQFVPFHERAWHCGVSQWKGRERCNDFSIGIELEGTDDDAFTIAQYAKLIGVTQLLQRAYPLTHVAAHSEIAPDRKTDPGPHFNWRLYRSATGLQ